MQTRNLNLFFFVSLIIAFTACGEKTNDKPIVKIFPENKEIDAFAGEKTVFNIQVFSDFKLTQLIVTQKFSGGQETVIFDTTPGVLNFNMQWAFFAPSEIEEDLYLYFKAINENGFQTTIGRKLIFKGKRLQEFTGLKLNSANSGNPAAFNFSTLQQVAASADSMLRDIQEYQSDTASTALAKKWVSPSNCQFVKFNSFDYSNASGTTARDAYNAGIKLTEIANIEINDIYIVKLLRLAPDDVYTVVKITNIIDAEGKANDFYEFAVKK
ncbi:MAG: hypothetical protein JXB34_09205 [Bacteroidales bacterium]|nr:hypothetical protein [Bacteroidales bacterium]